MRGNRIILWILFLLFCYSLKAQETNEMKIRATGSILPKEYLYLVGGDLNVEQHGETTRFILADSSYIDLYYYLSAASVHRCALLLYVYMTRIGRYCETLLHRVR